MNHNYKYIFLLIILNTLISCGGGSDQQPPALDNVVFSDADGSLQANGSIERPYTIEEAIATSEEVIVVLDSGGTVIVHDLFLLSGQQILGAGENGQVDIVFKSGATQTIEGLGNRPIIRNDISGKTIILNDNNKIQGINIVSTSLSYSEPVIFGTGVSNIILDDLIIESSNRGINLSNVNDLTISNIRSYSTGNSIMIEGCQGNIILRNISSSSTESGKILVLNNEDNLQLTNITFDGGTEGGLNIFFNEGNVTLDNLRTTSGAAGIQLSGYSGSLFTIRNLEMADSFDGLHISGASETLVENVTFNNLLVGISIDDNNGYITLNNININNQSNIRYGIVGISIDNGTGEVHLNDTIIQGDTNTAVSVTSNIGAININTLSASNITGGSAIQIIDNQGFLFFNDLELSNGNGNGIEVMLDRSIDSIQISNSTINQFIGHGIQLEYCEGSYIFSNIIMSNIGGEEINFSSSPSAVVTRN